MRADVVCAWMILVSACDPYRVSTPPAGTPCAADRECGDDLCVDRECAPTCSAGAEDGGCPASWDCLSVPGRTGAAACSCRGSLGATEVCNGRDDDCDEHVDEEAVCATGEVCRDGACLRPDGASCTADDDCLGRSCSAGTCGARDAGTPADAGGDAGTPADAGGDAGTGAPVDCGGPGVRCTAAEDCCNVYPDALSCVPRGTCGHLVWTCDGPEDCAGGDCCRGTSQTRCTPAGACAASTICRSPDDCRGGDCQIDFAGLGHCVPL